MYFGVIVIIYKNQRSFVLVQSNICIRKWST